MSAEFTKGVNLKTVETKYGEIIKVGINLDEIANNPKNGSWVNFDIKKGKSGSYYAQNQTPNK